tara:strand:- start:690 stop:2879 length:2190 start_codon:yes stop_codon:yes gene_type:complete
MGLTIEQALQQGVAAHKEGQLQDAERLYRAILKSQPEHPDANHNLGVLAVSVNKAEAALPLFKAALEVNPGIEQFWLSYIDALIKAQQFDAAKQALKQAKQRSTTEEKLNVLEERLPLSVQAPKPRLSEQKKKKAKEQNFKVISPSQEQLTSLLEHYQNGRFDEAEKLSISITQEFPKLQFGWKVLGAVLKQTGRTTESLTAMQTSAQLAPQDAEAHSNLGVTLQELGRLDEAEASLMQAIALKPNFAEAHSNLGNTLIKLGRLDEAEASITQAIALKSDYVEAHSNLGNTLKELGRLDEAEASLRQAIVLKPDYAEAHSNLGVTLQELGRLDEAEASITQAIALKPDFAEAYSNMGVALQELGRLDEAEASLTQAIALRPDSAEAHSNLGNTLKELGRLDEAEASLRQAIALKPDSAEAIYNLSIVQSYMNNLAAEIISLQNLLRIDSDSHGFRAGVNLAICNFLKGDFEESKINLLAVVKVQEKTSSKFKNQKVYQSYLLKILKWHEDKNVGGDNRKITKTLYVIGESHSLVSHHLSIQHSRGDFFCEARLIMGCKQWHLGNAFKNCFKNQFESIFSSIPKSSEVLLAIGEIDCRLNSGIIEHKNKFPEKDIEEIIADTIENYLTYIMKNNCDYQHTVIIQGVPCPNIDTGTYTEKEVMQLIEVIRQFNIELENKSREKGLEFLDVYKLTDRGDGFSNALWHIDKIHLSPEGFLEAWRRYIPKQKFL